MNKRQRKKAWRKRYHAINSLWYHEPEQAEYSARLRGIITDETDAFLEKAIKDLFDNPAPNDEQVGYSGEVNKFMDQLTENERTALDKADIEY